MFCHFTTLSAIANERAYSFKIITLRDFPHDYPYNLHLDYRDTYTLATFQAGAITI